MNAIYNFFFPPPIGIGHATENFKPFLSSDAHLSHRGNISFLNPRCWFVDMKKIVKQSTNNKQVIPIKQEEPEIVVDIPDNTKENQSLLHYKIREPRFPL